MRKFYFHPLATLGFAILALQAYAPAASAQNSSSGDSPFRPDRFEISAFGGGDRYWGVPSGPGSLLTTSWLGGLRATENLTEHFALEESGSYGPNQSRFWHPVAGVAVMNQPFDNQVIAASIDGVYHLTRLGSRIRPFLAGGFGGVRFDPTQEAKDFWMQNTVNPVESLRPETRMRYNAGVGVKIRLTNLFGVRADLRGFMSRNPTFGIATSPITNAYIPNGDWLYGVEATGGITINWGARRSASPTPKADKMPPNTTVPAATVQPKMMTPIDHRLDMAPISVVPDANASFRGANTVCAGTSVRLAAQGNDTLGHRVLYRWFLNGDQMIGDQSELLLPLKEPGEYRVRVAILDSDPNPAAALSPPMVILHAEDCHPAPTAACSVSPREITMGQTAVLNLAATVAPGETAQILWTTTEGILTRPTQAQTTFNSTGLSFPTSSMVQTKTVTATATVSDESGKKAQCSTSFRVSTKPVAIHYGDIVFANGSARINNCAKRILIERVYPELTGAYQGYTLVLVGHIDAGEKASSHLDRQRVLNAAAVLSAGVDVCKNLEPSRIKADFVGTTNTEYKETSCSVSFESAPEERAGDRVNPSDAKAKNRRVEIWLVPAGQAMPPSVKEAHTLPTQELQRLSCPR